jgi:copper chaperone CopZ
MLKRLLLYYVTPTEQHLIWCIDGRVIIKHTKERKMKTEDIIIANLKCSGCATTIKRELIQIRGVKNAIVDVEKDMVTVSYGDVDRDVIVNKLHSLGYPEATEKNGLLLQLKSYASCMVGKMNNL